MSRQRVITGTDERGRPVSQWEDVAVAPPAFGHMEPAYSTTVDRRQATDEQRAQWAAEATPTSAAPTPRPPKDRYTADDLQARRQRGQAMMRAAIAAEEPTVTDLFPEKNAPEDVIAPGPFTDIAAAALEAARRQQELAASRIAAVAAEAAYQEALTALEAAWSGAGLETPLVAPDAAPVAVVVPAKPKAAPGPKRSRNGWSETQDKAERARRAVEALERHGGDKRAAAAELGIKANALAMIVKHAAGKVTPTVAA